MSPIHSAIDEIHDWYAKHFEADANMSDDQLLARMVTLTTLLDVRDKAGDAEGCHETVRELAAFAILYLARGNT